MTEILFYIDIGKSHILDLQAYDHLLFIVTLCAVFDIHQWKQIMVMVTAFTIGHSVSLALSVLNVFYINNALVETLIPVTIVLAAGSNILRRNNPMPSQFLSNYILAGLFGLIHGLGFSIYLKQLLGDASSLLLPLLGFNVGLEVGQLLIVLVYFAIVLAVDRFGFLKRNVRILAISIVTMMVGIKMIIEVWV